MGVVGQLVFETRVYRTVRPKVRGRDHMTVIERNVEERAAEASEARFAVLVANAIARAVHNRMQVFVLFRFVDNLEPEVPVETIRATNVFVRRQPMPALKLFTANFASFHISPPWHR